MATAPEENHHEVGGLGTGGKFRKRPFRRNQTTPYDRPPTALRNPNRNNGWLSKLVDPAQRLITSSAYKLFSSVFRKQLPPPPQPPQPSSCETEQDVRDNYQEATAFVTSDSTGKQQGAAGEIDIQANCSDRGGFTELEKLLKQKTFTRSEINHLTALLHSKAVDSSFGEETRTEVVPSEPMLSQGGKEEVPKTPAPENGNGNCLVSTPFVNSGVLDEDVASPAELAKAYMGNRPSKVSPSMLGLQSPALREEAAPSNSQHFSPKSHIWSVVPRATSHARVPENGYVTPKSRGRSAIYSMARTPYARVYPTSTLKSVGFAVEAGPSSSAQSSLDHDSISGSKEGALKRRSSVLDNDIGSVGPIRRIRHKSNLLSSKGLSLPVLDSPLSITRSIGANAAQQPSSSMQKPLLLGEAKPNNMKLSLQDIDDTVPSTGFPPLPSKSSEMASKILQQLDKLVSPKEKSSELKGQAVNDKSPTKLSPSMLRGQALRSMETVDSSKFLENAQDIISDGAQQNLLASSQKLTVKKQDKVENGPLELVAPSGGLVPVVTDAKTTTVNNQIMSGVKSADSSMNKPISHPPQKKMAFHMSAHEDYLEPDDDAYLKGVLSSSTAKERTDSTAVMENTASATETIVQENHSVSSIIESALDNKAHVGTADRSAVDQKVIASTDTASAPGLTLKPVAVVGAAMQSISGSDKSAPPVESISAPSLFGFGNNNLASSKESAVAAPIFSFAEKVVSSKESVASAPVFNFGTNQNLAKVPPMSLASSSLGGDSVVMKFGSASDSRLGSSISSTTVAVSNDAMPKFLESDSAAIKTTSDSGFCVRTAEPAVSLAEPTSLPTSTSSTFAFGNSSSQNIGPSSSSPLFPSPFPPHVSNNSTSLNLLTSSSLSATMAPTNSCTSPVIASTNNSCSTSVVASSSSTTSFFKFGSTPMPSTDIIVSSSSSSGPVDTKSGQDAGFSNIKSTAFGGTSVAVGSAGSGIFGFSSPAMAAVNNQSQGSAFGSSSGPVLGTQSSATTGFAATTQSQSFQFGAGQASTAAGFATSTQNQSTQFGSSASSPFGLSVNATFSSGSSLFASSSPATSIFNSNPTFGLGTSTSSSAANSVSSNNNTSSSLFGHSSWQPNKTPFGSVPTFSSSSSSSGFSFGASTASISSSTSSPMAFASSPIFSLMSAAATTSTQPGFNPNPAFAFSSASPVNNDQMSMEDSMAEDTVQATPPAAPVFGQQPTPPQSTFAFGVAAPSGASPFQFGTQENITPQNQSPFQASGSLEFNAGGSFSLGTGGGDKSGRRILRVKGKHRRK